MCFATLRLQYVSFRSQVHEHELNSAHAFPHDDPSPQCGKVTVVVLLLMMFDCLQYFKHYCKAVVAV